MKVLVTGRAGQVARALAEVWEGAELHFTSRTEFDLERPGDAGRVVSRLRPDLVISAAAYTAVDQAEAQEQLAMRLNGVAPGELATAAARTGAPIVHLSTDYVFDGTAKAPIGEAQPVAPISVYGRSKLAGEAAVIAANPRHLILRTAWLFSPWEDNFVTKILAAAQERATLRVVEDQCGSPTSALDLARAIGHAGERLCTDESVCGIFHLVNRGAASWYDVARAAIARADEVGRLAKVQPIKTSEWPTPARRPAYSVLDSRAFERTFAHDMRDWRVALDDVVDRIVGNR